MNVFTRSIIIALGLTAMAYAAEVPASHVGQLATVQLSNGTTAVGVVLQEHDGGFTLVDDSLKKIKLDASAIETVSFESIGVASSTSKRRPTNQEQTTSSLEAIGAQILANPQTSAAVSKLMADPDMQKIMADEALMKAAMKGDYMKLLNDPKIQNLMNNETVRSISSELIATPNPPSAPVSDGEVDDAADIVPDQRDSGATTVPAAGK